MRQHLSQVLQRHTYMSAIAFVELLDEVREGLQSSIEESEKYVPQPLQHVVKSQGCQAVL